MSAPDWLTARPIAHRGLHDRGAGIPENSLAAASAAVEAGYAIECDVRPAADGTPMVFHDRTLDRLTGETGPLDDRTPAELGALRLLRTREPVATLEALLGTIAGRAGLLVEIKSDGPGDGRFEGAVCACLAGYAGPAAVMSFEPASLGACARAAPRIPRGLVSRAYGNDEDRQRLGAIQRWARRNLVPAVETGARFVAYDAQALPALAPALARLAGLAVLTWTVRDAVEERRLRRHVDQIIFEDFRP